MRQPQAIVTGRASYSAISRVILHVSPAKDADPQQLRLRADRDGHRISIKPEKVIAIVVAVMCNMWAVRREAEYSSKPCNSTRAGRIH